MIVVLGLQRGDVVSQLRKETGATIKIGEQVPGCNDRIIHVHSSTDPLDEWSAAQRALFRVHECISEKDTTDSEASDQCTVSYMLLGKPDPLDMCMALAEVHKSCLPLATVKFQLSKICSSI